jgi:hypothetical protein
VAGARGVFSQQHVTRTELLPLPVCDGDRHLAGKNDDPLVSRRDVVLPVGCVRGLHDERKPERVVWPSYPQRGYAVDDVPNLALDRHINELRAADLVARTVTYRNVSSAFKRLPGRAELEAWLFGAQDTVHRELKWSRAVRSGIAAFHRQQPRGPDLVRWRLSPGGNDRVTIGSATP